MVVPTTGTEILALLGAGLALFFDYFPWVASWFDALQTEQKRLITLGLSMLIGALVFVGSCLSWFSTTLACDYPTALGLAYDIVIVVATAYGFHQMTKPSFGMKRALGYKAAKLSAPKAKK